LLAHYQRASSKEQFLADYDQLARSNDAEDATGAENAVAVTKTRAGLIHYQDVW
jgi:hypothetical protein